MYMQTRSAESAVRYAATGVLAMLLVVAITFPAISQEPEEPETMMLRGIYMNPGDTAETAITPVGDEDMFVFDALADSELAVDVRSIYDSGLRPGLAFLMPDGTQLDISEYLKEKKAKAKLRLPAKEMTMTGRYGLIVSGREETDGDYKLKLAVTPPKRRKEQLPVKVLELKNIRFGAYPDTIVKVSIKSKGGPVYVVHVVDPKGFAIPAAEGLFKETDEGLEARLYPTHNWGNYYIGLRGNLDTEVNVTVKIRTNHTPPIPRDREITKHEPIIDNLDPDTGIDGNGIVINGLNFQPGFITVFFGDVESPGAFYVDQSKINVIVPWQGEISNEPGFDPTVDVTVYNPDGQAVTKEDAFTYEGYDEEE